MEAALIIAVILGPFLVRFLAKFLRQAQAAYIEAEKERLRTAAHEGRKKAGNRGYEERRDNSTGSRDERHYAYILGLEKGNGPDDVKRAYRRLAPQYHPDKVNHLGPKIQELAAQTMKEINEAYGYFKQKYELD